MLDTPTILIILAAVIGSSSMTGVIVWLAARTSRQSVVERDDVERLTEGLEHLHEQLHQLRGSVGELNERMDFAERLLTRGDAKPRDN
jgi:hypothetical protein